MTRNNDSERPPDAVIRAMASASEAYVSIAACFLSAEAMRRVWADFEIGDDNLRDGRERAAVEQLSYGFWARVSL